MTAPSYSSTYPYPYPLMTAPLPPSPEPSQSPQENLQEHPSPSSHDPAPMHDTQASTPPATTPSTPAEAPQGHRCLWLDCTQTYVDPEALYNHLCNDHIGRKSTNNLCLTCKWKDCGTTCAKRDHITSHLRGMLFARFSRYSCLSCKLPGIYNLFFFTSPHPAKATHMRGKDLITGDALTSPDYRFIRFAKRPSSVHKTSRSTKRSIPRSIMPSINTPRLSLLSILLTFNVFAVIPAAARTLVSRFRLHPPLSRSSPVPVPNHIRRRLRMVCFQAVRVFILGQLLNLGH